MSYASEDAEAEFAEVIACMTEQEFARYDAGEKFTDDEWESIAGRALSRSGREGERST